MEKVKINMVPVPQLKKLNSGTGTEVNQFTKAFTLVELIVVITILSILATVGFVSFSGYLSGARDTNRIAQLKSMSDALELYRTRKDLPIPDSFLEIRNGTTSSDRFAYQGNIGKNALETIEYTESGLDPKDKQYFSYYLTRSKKYFQLIALLEEESDDVVAFNKTFAINFADRFPIVKGKKLGILTDVDNTPIQKLSALTNSGYLDISDIGETKYKAILKSNDILSGTGTTFLVLQTFAEKGGTFCSSSNLSCINNEDLITMNAGEGWNLVDTNCHINDIKIGNQIWDGCNSTLGNGSIYYSKNQLIG